MLSWMAWTWQTALFFVFIFTAILVLVVIEIVRPGQGERQGILGLVTTRGDRLFITLLGAAYIFFGWIGLFGLPLWWPIILTVAWGGLCFWKV